MSSSGEGVSLASPPRSNWRETDSVSASWRKAVPWLRLPGPRPACCRPTIPTIPAELAELAALSIKLYPEYLSMVERLSGRVVPVRTQATLVTSRMGSEFHPNETKVCPSLSAEEAERRIPGLATAGRSFCWMEESSLDPRDLCAALPLAAAAAGVEVQQETEVLAVTSRNSLVEVRTQSGRVSAGAFVNCCGAWAGAVRLSGQEQPARCGRGAPERADDCRPCAPAAGFAIRSALTGDLPGTQG